MESTTTSQTTKTEEIVRITGSQTYNVFGIVFPVAVQHLGREFLILQVGSVTTQELSKQFNKLRSQLTNSPRITEILSGDDVVPKKITSPEVLTRQKGKRPQVFAFEIVEHGYDALKDLESFCASVLGFGTIDRELVEEIIPKAEVAEGSTCVLVDPGFIAMFQNKFREKNVQVFGNFVKYRPVNMYIQITATNKQELNTIAELCVRNGRVPVVDPEALTLQLHPPVPHVNKANYSYNSSALEQFFPHVSITKKLNFDEEETITVKQESATTTTIKEEKKETIASVFQTSISIMTDMKTAPVKSEGEDIVALFNVNPRKAIKMLKETKTEIEIAQFLVNTKDLDKKKIGELLGAESSMLLDAVLSLIPFQGLDLVDAMRAMFLVFKLAQEAQSIDRMMMRFANRYFSENPRSMFASADAVYTLAYALIMLNTDLHLASITNKMDHDRFIKNCAGVNDGGDFPADVLVQAFDKIQAEAFNLL